MCIRCRDSCLAQKEREKNAALALQPARHAVLSSLDLKGPVGAGATRASQFVGAGQIEIAPPVWDDIDKYVECGKCHKKGGKPHSQNDTRTDAAAGRRLAEGDWSTAGSVISVGNRSVVAASLFAVAVTPWLLRLPHVRKVILR